MMGRSGYAVVWGGIFLAGILVTMLFPRMPELASEDTQRKYLIRFLAEELNRGAMGGIGLERLAEMTAGGAVGIWQSAVFDPVENCWYLPGWIDNAQTGSWRVALLLTPVPGHGKTHAWRFYLRCAGLVPFDQPAIDVEGAWREDDDGLRLAWNECSSGGQGKKDAQIVRVSRQKLLQVARNEDVRRRVAGSLEGSGSCRIASIRHSPDISPIMPDGGTRNAITDIEP